MFKLNCKLINISDEKNGKPWMWINVNEEKVLSIGYKAVGEFLRVFYLKLETLNL